MAQLAPRDSCFTCPKIDRFDWCSRTLKGLAAVDNSKSTRIYARKEAIFHEGDPCDGVYCVQSGEIAVGKSDREGNTVILRIADSRSTLGLPGYFAGGAHSTTAIALTPSRACYVPRSAVEALVDQNPRLAYEFFKHVAAELDAMENLYLSNQTTTVRERVIHLLDSFKERYGIRRPDGGMVIRWPLTRTDLAALVATRPETISRTIQQLRLEGIADFLEKDVSIPDVTRLALEAGHEAA